MVLVVTAEAVEVKVEIEGYTLRNSRIRSNTVIKRRSLAVLIIVGADFVDDLVMICGSSGRLSRRVEKRFLFPPPPPPAATRLQPNPRAQLPNTIVTTTITISRARPQPPVWPLGLQLECLLDLWACCFLDSPSDNSVLVERRQVI